MKNRQANKKCLALLLWALTFIWLGICVLLSSQNGTETGNLSIKISRFIIRFSGLSPDFLYPLNAHLRTAAHVMVFFVLALLGGCASRVPLTQHSFAPLWFFFLCVLFSIFDEIRKAGIPGRHCSFAEAGLNVVGCVLGCGAAYLIFYIYNHRGSHKNLKSK